MKVLTTNWGEMLYSTRQSSGVNLIFLHGTGCDSSDWQSVLQHLSRIYGYITLDFRGHGKSSVPLRTFSIANLAEDVLYLISELGIQECILVGHSLGGMVAMEVAKRSNLISSIVLLEGWTNLLSAGSAFNSDRFYGSLPQSEITKIQQKSEGTRSRFNADVWNSFWSSVKHFDGYDYLQQTHIPIFEVFGEMGRTESTEQKLNIPKKSNIKLIWLPSVRHYLPHECPMKVAEICNKVLETVQSN